MDGIQVETLKTYWREYAPRAGVVQFPELKVFKTFRKLHDVREKLQGKFSIPEAREFLRAQTRGNTRQWEDTPVWRFNDVLMRKLDDKGWPMTRPMRELILNLYPDKLGGSLQEVSKLLDHVRRKGNVSDAAVTYLMGNIDGLRRTAQEMLDLTEGDLKRSYITGEHRYQDNAFIEWYASV